jgi:hypothetical protein
MPTASRTKPRRLAYSFTETAAMFGRNRALIYRLVKQGKLKPLVGYGAAMIPTSEIIRVFGVDPNEIDQ